MGKHSIQRCIVCNRPLSSNAISGMGPTCARKYAQNQSAKLLNDGYIEVNYTHLGAESQKVQGAFYHPDRLNMVVRIVDAQNLAEVHLLRDVDNKVYVAEFPHKLSVADGDEGLKVIEKYPVLTPIIDDFKTETDGFWGVDPRPQTSYTEENIQLSHMLDIENPPYPQFSKLNIKTFDYEYFVDSYINYEEEIDDYELDKLKYLKDAILIEDVFVKDKYMGQGYGSKVVEVIKGAGKPVVLYSLYESVEFWEKQGFKNYKGHEYIMIYESATIQYKKPILFSSSKYRIEK